MENTNKVHIEAGIPVELVENDNWAAVDILDTSGLYYCRRCGRLTGSAELKLPDDLKAEHLHGRLEADLVEINFGDHNLLATVIIIRREGRLLDIFDTFNMPLFMPNEKDLQEPEALPNEITVTALTAQGITLVRELLRLGESYASDWPMWTAAARLLNEWREEELVSKFGQVCLALAVLLRTNAYQPDLFRKLRVEANLAEGDVKQMLEMVDREATDYLHWGLTWAELFYLHG